ncbi:MAG: DegT/DnrJ/EryC1/StrS family aminotransferase [Deltaproteobacteria bacterium]
MIPHSRPTLDQTDYENVLHVLRSGNLVQGEQVCGLEDTLSALIGVSGGVAVSSGTAALHLALLSLGIQKGDEVILPSFVCSAPLNAIRYTGAEPVIADVDRHTFNIDVHDLKRRITPKTKAVIVPHMFGLSADVDDIKSFGIPVIEDCAQSLGSRYKGAYTGSFGDLSIFSFYATKMIATGEGGMVLSNNESLTEIIRDFRDYDKKEHYNIRYNYKMTDIQAALGISQLNKLSFFIERRKYIADIYHHECKNCGFETPVVTSEGDHIYYRYVLLLDHVDQFIHKMTQEGVACRRPVFKPLHRYLSLSGYETTDWLWERAVSIPIYPSLMDNEISKIIEAVKLARSKHV